MYISLTPISYYLCATLHYRLTMQPTQPVSIPDVIQQIPLNYYLIFSTALFVIGIIGVLTRRNAIIIFMSIELMLNAVNMLLVAFSSYKSDSTGQVFVFFIMAVAAAEVSVGLAIIVMIYRNTRSIDIGALNKLKW